MGFLDITHVCTNCRNVDFAPGSSSVCSKCGATSISVNIVPKRWKAMSEEQQAKAIEEAFAAKESGQAEAYVIDDEGEKAITTTDSFINADIEEYLGTVGGTDIYMTAGLVGGGLSTQEKLFGTAFSTAKSAMMKKALERGGNAVVGMSVNLCQADGYTLVIVAGTAVKVKMRE